MRVKKKLCLLIFGLVAAFGAQAQNVALKTNLLSDVALSPNLGIEIGLAPHWTLNTSANINAWTVHERKWKHWLVQPEARYWFCDRFARHFLGLHLIGGEYNFGHIKNGISFLGSDFTQLKENRYQGWAVGAGVAYGYAFILGRNWNLELELGVGYIYTQYDKYKCQDCGKKVDSADHHYYGPTKAAINLVYLF